MDTHAAMRAVAKSDLTGRARLREAALELSAERRFDATSTRAVAAAAGLSPALVTRHLGSKQGLRAAVDEYVLDRIGAQLRALDAAKGVMASLGEGSARVFGADPVLRSFLRQVLVEDSEASAAADWSGPSWRDLQFGHLWFIQNLLA